MATKNRNDSLVHGVDCLTLGSRYASRLMGNTKAELAAMPELLRHPLYRKLKDCQRAEVRATIKFVARAMLILAGNNPALVEKVIADK